MHIRYVNAAETQLCLQAVCKGLGRFLLAMHNEGMLRFFLHGSSPGEEFIAVSMTTETGDDLHMCLHIELVTEYFYNWFFADHAAAQCIGGLPARHQDCIARITYPTAQVVQNAAAFHHAAGTDNDSRFLQGVKFFGFLNICSEFQGVKSKRICMVIV